MKPPNGDAYLERLDHTGSIAELNEIIDRLSLTVAFMADDPTHLGVLGCLYQDRYGYLKDPADLDKGIELLSQAVDRVLLGQTGDLTWISNLVLLYRTRFENTKETLDLNNAIHCLTKSITLVPQQHPILFSLHSDLSALSRTRFRHLSHPADLNIALDHRRRALKLISQDHSDMPEQLFWVGLLLKDRFELLGKSADLDEAIECFNQIILHVLDGHPEKPRWYGSLGNLYQMRFENRGIVGDLAMAIDCLNCSVSTTPNDHRGLPIRLTKLGSAYRVRFKRFGNIEDINKAIEIQDQAVSQVSHGYVHQYIGELGLSYRDRYEHTGSLADLNQAVDCLSQAAELQKNRHNNSYTVVHNLSMVYFDRFKRLGNMADIDQAIELGMQTRLSLTGDRPRRAGFLTSLGAFHEARYARLQDLQDLALAIDYHSEALTLAPPGHPERPIYLTNLGNGYLRRFVHSGELRDLDTSISHQCQAEALTPDDDANKMLQLGNLSISYQERFNLLGEHLDLDMGIKYQSQAVFLTPENHLHRPARLGSLGNSYLVRFEELKYQADLEMVISCYSQALAITPKDHPDMASRLSQLGVSYCERAEFRMQREDLEQAIDYQTQAICLSANDDTSVYEFEAQLGSSYFDRFRFFGWSSLDLDSAIKHLGQAIQHISNRNSNASQFLIAICAALYERFHLFHDPDDIGRAIFHAQEGAQKSTSLPLDRFAASRIWATLSTESRISPLEAYKQAMALIPQLIWLGSSSTRRYERIHLIRDLALEAATAAVKFQKFDMALEWLEEGRSVLWNQLLQLRSPLEQLSNVNTSLAKRLKESASKLEQAMHPGRIIALDLPANRMILEAAIQQQHRQAENWEQLVEETRVLPGMHGFLRPINCNELVAAACYGALVEVVVHISGCYALIVRPRGTVVEFLPLSNITYDKLVSAREHLAHLLHSQGRTSRGVIYRSQAEHSMVDLLAMLWDQIAKPVLEFLGYSRPPFLSELPHVTWCTTGPLSFLPLHATGDYSRSFCSVFDWTFSSFTPNLGTLLRTTPDPMNCSGTLAIGQVQTPGHQPLLGTVAELDAIGRQIGDTRYRRLEGIEATTIAVLEVLDDYSWVHFACHAGQNIAIPTASAFHLQDGPLDLASIARKQLKNADLAFLSACQTATGDIKLSEESIHLASGMLMAGYRRVIATMWSINDNDAPLVAEKFYAYMLDDNKPSDAKAGRALHYAVGCLRDKIGVSEFTRWAPYIHIGL